MRAICSAPQQLPALAAHATSGSSEKHDWAAGVCRGRVHLCLGNAAHEKDPVETKEKFAYCVKLNLLPSCSTHFDFRNPLVTTQ